MGLHRQTLKLGAEGYLSELGIPGLGISTSVRPSPQECPVSGSQARRHRILTAGKAFRTPGSVSASPRVTADPRAAPKLKHCETLSGPDGLRQELASDRSRTKAVGTLRSVFSCSMLGCYCQNRGKTEARDHSWLQSARHRTAACFPMPTVEQLGGKTRTALAPVLQVCPLGAEYPSELGAALRRQSSTSLGSQ